MDAWGQRCFGNGWTDRQTEMCNSRVALATENLLLCMSVCHNSCIVKEDWWAGVIKVVAIRNQTTNYIIEGQSILIKLLLVWHETFLAEKYHILVTNVSHSKINSNLSEDLNSW